MPTAQGRTEAGGAHYHLLQATKAWALFRESEQAHAKRPLSERMRDDERRQDADLSVRAGRPNG